MEQEALAEPCPAPQTFLIRQLLGSLAAIIVPVVVISLLLLAWVVHNDRLFSSSSAIGYWLGVAGGSLMLLLLIYPLRKRFRVLALLGPLKHWFRFHLFAGIAGPVLVLFHSTFRVGSFNAAIALTCMLLVVASGIVGRFIYRKIHNGLYGSRATAVELRLSLDKQVESLRGALVRLPDVEREMGQFSALVALQPTARWRQMLYFASLGYKRYLASNRVRRAIARHEAEFGSDAAATQEHLRQLSRTIDNTLQAIQRTAQFSNYERLFSLWHVVHIPFLFLLVVTAIVHVVAVHAY